MSISVYLSFEVFQLNSILFHVLSEKSTSETVYKYLIIFIINLNQK